MTEQPETVDDRLKRLAQATSGLRARPGFQARVMLAVQSAAAPGWLESAVLSARIAFAVALLTATAAIALALQTDAAAIETSAAAYTAVGLGW